MMKQLTTLWLGLGAVVLTLSVGVWLLMPGSRLPMPEPVEAAAPGLTAEELAQRRIANNVASTVSEPLRNPEELTRDGNTLERREQVRKRAAYLAKLPSAPGTTIGTFATSLAGNSAEGRVKNIRLANQKLNGRILMPGEVLSFNEELGDSNDPRAGWQLAAVIVGKKFEQGYGGGICQVSSTLYNSVLRAGLGIKERHTHSLPVGYVLPGQDATVSYPELDFRFQNTLQQPVRIHAGIQGGNVICMVVRLPAEGDL